MLEKLDAFKEIINENRKHERLKTLEEVENVLISKRLEYVDGSAIANTFDDILFKIRELKLKCAKHRKEHDEE